MVSKLPPSPPKKLTRQPETTANPQHLRTISGPLSNYGLELPSLDKSNNTEVLSNTYTPKPRPLPPSHMQSPPQISDLHAPVSTPLPRPHLSMMQGTPQPTAEALSPSLSGEFFISDLLVNRYLLTKKIGQGGMGQVFSATDQRLSRQVVVKVSHGQGNGPSPEDRARFEREALKMASLNHPNIVTIYDYGEHRGDQFLVMELIRGETLKGFINHPSPISLSLFKEIITQLLKGVEDAHNSDVIHRDLKPSNLMWDAEKRVLKILDFGLARGVEGDTVTGTGHVHGSIQYMAPEQIKGEPQGPTTDIYAIGILCFQLLSKTLPFRGENTVELMFQKLQKDPFNLLEQDQTPKWVTDQTAKLIVSCLQLDQSQRPQSAAECLTRLLQSLPNSDPEHDQLFGQSDDLFDHSPHTTVFSDSTNTDQHLTSPPSLFSRFKYQLLVIALILNAAVWAFSDQLSTTLAVEQKSTAASVHFTSLDVITGVEVQVDLSLNGVAKGLTPLKLEVPAGRHEVALSSAEWSFKKVYEIEAGESYWYSLPAPSTVMIEMPTPQIPRSETELSNSLRVPSVTGTGKPDSESSASKPSRISSKKKKRAKRKRKTSSSRRALRRSQRSKKTSKVKRKSGSSKNPSTSRSRSPSKDPSPKTTIDVPLLEMVE